MEQLFLELGVNMLDFLASLKNLELSSFEMEHVENLNKFSPMVNAEGWQP